MGGICGETTSTVWLVNGIPAPFIPDGENTPSLGTVLEDSSSSDYNLLLVQH